MPKRPQGRKGPGDAAGNPVKPGSKEPEEFETERVKRAAAELGSRGGKAHAARMPPERRTEIARRAAAKR